MALTDQDDGTSAAGSEDVVLGACRALVRHRYGRWLSTAEAGNRPAGVITQAVAARSGGPSPTGRDAHAFQRGVLDEIMAAA